MVETLLQVPKFTEETINAIITDLFNSEHIQEKLEDLVRYRQGGDTIQAAPGSLGASNPQLLELLKQKQKEENPLQTLTQEAIANYKDLWQKAQNHEAVDRYGRAPLIHSVPHEDDSLVGVVLHNLEFGNSRRVKQIVSNGVHLGDVYESQILYGEERHPFLRLNLPGWNDKERGGEPVLGKTYVVAASPWAGYSVDLFVPSDRRYARVRIRAPEAADRWQFKEYDGFSNVATKLFQEILDTKNIHFETAAVLYAATVAEEDGTRVHLREAFDRAIKSRSRPDSGLGSFGITGEEITLEDDKTQTPRITVEETNKHYEEIMSYIRNFSQQITYADRSSLSILEERLQRAGNLLQERYQGADMQFVGAQYAILNRTNLTNNGVFPLDVGIIAYTTAKVIETRERIWNHVYSRLAHWIEFLENKNPDSVLSDEEHKRLDGYFGMFNSYMGLHSGLTLPWQAVHILGREQYVSLVNAIVQNGLMGDGMDSKLWDLSEPDSIERVVRTNRDMHVPLFDNVPLSKLPAEAQKYDRFVDKHEPLFTFGQEDKVKREPTFNFHNFYLLRFVDPAIKAMEQYKQAQQQTSS